MLEELTPRQIVAELDRYIIGQASAKRAVAIALRNRYRRRLLGDELKNEVIPKNILMIGSTGVGKTEIARRLAGLAHAPFIKVEATKFTEVGYVGRDVDSMIRDLVQESVRIVEKELEEKVQDEAESRAVDRIVDILQPKPKSKAQQMVGQVGQSAESFAEALNNLFHNGPAPTHSAPKPTPPPQDPAADEAEQRRQEQLDRIRRRIREQIVSGARDEEDIEIELEDSAPTPIVQVMGGPEGGQDGAGGGMDMGNMFSSLLPKRRKNRTVKIKDAKRLFTAEEARALIDHDQVNSEAIDRAEQTGIIFIDEMDKIAGRTGDGGGRGPDVSREGVQRDILPIIEGSTVHTKFGQVRTDFMLFIAAGAFHISKPSDLIPELQGRLPIRVELDSLNRHDFQRILTEPRNALIKQYTALLNTEGVSLTFTDDAIEEIARIAEDVNTRMENIGARRLHTVMERLLDELSFEAPDVESKAVTVDAEYVRQRLASIVKDEDLSRYVL